MSQHDYSVDVIAELSTWPEIRVEAHRFGGREFLLGKVEIGHIHRGGMLDIPYTVPLREQLVAEGKTGLHHLLAESGWTSFYVHSKADMEQGLWLLSLSLLQKRLSRARRKPETLADLQTQASKMGLSAALWDLLF